MCECFRQNERVQRLLSVRITRWPIKLGFVAAAYAIGIPFVWLIPNAYVGSAINFVLTLGAVWYGARVFRGRGEAIAPARRWWRMTAWRRASGWIGLLCVLGAATGAFAAFPQIVDPEGYGDQPVSVFDVLQISVPFAILAFFYLNSWARLRAIPTPPRSERAQAVIVKPGSKLT